jgi:hypothetical protein
MALNDTTHSDVELLIEPDMMTPACSSNRGLGRIRVLPLKI